MAKESRDFDTLLALTNELMDQVVNDEMELDYYNRIINGSWPDADGIIARRRASKTRLEHQAG